MLLRLLCAIAPALSRRRAPLAHVSARAVNGSELRGVLLEPGAVPLQGECRVLAVRRGEGSACSGLGFLGLAVVLWP